MATLNTVVARWLAAGKPEDSTGVPHEVKEWMVASYGETYGLKTLVETGTCYGHMCMAMAHNFSEIHTVELSPQLFEAAKLNLSKIAWVTQYQGDSAEQLANILGVLDGPALFFLDAHYSGGGTARAAIDTPIMQELRLLARSPHPNVIMIDDARLFEGEPFHTPEFKDYPSMGTISQFVKDHFVVPSEVIRDSDEFVVVPV